VRRWLEGDFDVLTFWNMRALDAADTIVEFTPDLHTRYLGFRADRPPFSNELVRKAFAHAIDRDGLLRPEDSERAATRGGMIPPAMPGHSHRVGPEYDLELAKKLLADAGYPEGRGLPELKMLLPRWLAPVADLLQDQVSRIGARLEFRLQERKFWSDALSDEDLWISGFGADYPDPDGFFRGLFREPFPFYRDDEIDELLVQSRSLGNQPERLRLYHEIDRLWVAEHAAVLPLAYSRSVALHRPWVEGFWANPLSKASLDQVVIKDRSAVAVPDEAEAVESK